MTFIRAIRELAKGLGEGHWKGVLHRTSPEGLEELINLLRLPAGANTQEIMDKLAKDPEVLRRYLEVYDRLKGPV
jgi:hypothetical protein